MFVIIYDIAIVTKRGNSNVTIALNDTNDLLKFLGNLGFSTEKRVNWKHYTEIVLVEPRSTVIIT